MDPVFTPQTTPMGKRGAFQTEDEALTIDDGPVGLVPPDTMPTDTQRGIEPRGHRWRKAGLEDAEPALR